MNEACVPNLALATGSPEWGKANEFPWYISALPSYATEAHAWVEYLKTAKPEAKIALLYQDDDFGLAYKNAITKAVKGTKITLVADQSVNVDFKDKEVLSDETRIHRILLLRSWLFHFVGSMHSYFMTRVIHSTELELRSDLANCSDLVTVLKFC